MKVYPHREGWFALQVPARLSADGKRRTLYFRSKTEAEKEATGLTRELREFGCQAVTPEDSGWLQVIRTGLDGRMDLIPQVLAHWKETGPHSITPMSAEDACMAFQNATTERFGRRTRGRTSDIG